MDKESSKSYNNEPIVMALGFFDGVHEGHQKLIELARKEAENKNLKSSVMSFKNHPLKKIFPRYAPKLLMNNEEKKKVIEDLGIDFVFLESFTESLMQLSPEEFIKDFLIKKYNIKTLVVGFNYTFGYKGKGKAKDLKELGEKYGFDVIIAQPISREEKAVSSTLIRELLGQGQVDKAADLLGRPYKITGKICEGKKLGRQYHIPTANLDYDSEALLPKSGVYYTKITVDGKTYDGLTNLGYNPTFPDHPYAIETYIYDFNDNIYGKDVSLEFLKYIRGDMKFNSVEELFEQIRSDLRKVDLLYRKKQADEN